MAGHDDPRLLYSINGIKAFHIQDGEEQSLTPSGPQTLSLLMVPTTSPFADLSTTMPQNAAPDQDFYLHLNLPPELDLPLPATTQIYHQPPRSYLIPRWDMGRDSGVFTRIEFPAIGHSVTQEDVDTFETILAQCTAFLERAPPPKPDRPMEKYNPADYAKGGKHAGLDGRGQGQIVLIDEDDGSVVGELSQEAVVHEDSSLEHGHKDPVEVQISADGKRIDVRPVSEDYLAMANHPAYKDSNIVKNAATASRLIVTSSSYIGNMLTSGADSFTQKTKPAAKPMEFTPATHERVRKINSFTHGAVGLSAKTVGQVTKVAQNIGASAARRGERKPQKGFNAQGQPDASYKPGLLNKSMIAFSTIADGIAQSGKALLETSGTAATTMVGHRYGPEAGSITSELAGGVKNVGLVYIDVTGVTRRAVLKSVAKGMVVGKVRGGGQVMVGGGDGGVIPDEDLRKGGVSNNNLGPGQASYSKGQEAGVVGFGSHAPYNDSAPPAYSSGVGENIAGSSSKGQYPPEKR